MPVWELCSDPGTGDFSREIFPIGCKISALRHGESTPLEWHSREKRLDAGGGVSNEDRGALDEDLNNSLFIRRTAINDCATKTSSNVAIKFEELVSNCSYVFSGKTTTHSSFQTGWLRTMHRRSKHPIYSPSE